MTQITRLVRRETAVTVRHRALIIEIRPHTLYVRQKGLRTGYEVDYESIWGLGAKKAAELRRMAKRKGGKV